MSNVKIVWITDVCECENCGASYADGAVVYKDGEVLVDFTPHAHCYDSDDYDSQTVFVKVLEALGHTVDVEHESSGEF